MEMSPNAIATGLVLLATVSGTLACETLTPLGSDTPATTPGSSNNTPMAGAGASMPVGANPGTGGASGVPSPAVGQEVMRRWNLAVDSTPSPIDFHWQEVDEFPHPTFKGGSAAAYGQFASVLLTFFRSGDNFDFLAQNHLFTMEIRDDTLSGQGDVVTNFEQLADSFSSSMAFGDITPDVHDGLAQIAQRIHQM